jgi:virulence-associated protein VagC
VEVAVTLYIPYIHGVMNNPIPTKTFMSGNSVAVRLPKGLGVAPDTAMEIVRQGGDLLLRRVVDPAQEQSKIAEMVRRLREIGPAGTPEVRDKIIFPDRPGLY